MRIVGIEPTGIHADVDLSAYANVTPTVTCIPNKNGVRGGTIKLKRKRKINNEYFPNTELKNINRSHQPFADTIIIPLN